MQILLVIWYIIAISTFIFGILSLIFYKQLVGDAGENWVKKMLKKLNKNEYFVINNLLVKSQKTVSQIDHVVVSKYGIFVIETKQYNGYIEGNEYDKNWLQNKKYIINNPIHQNYGHVKTLENALDLPEEWFIPIVCIPSTANLNITAEKNHVVRAYELNELITSYKKEIVSEYIYIYYKLITLNQTDPMMKRLHTNIVKNAINNKLNNNDLTKCPLCGGNLIERNGKYGAFMGCSNFPKCKFTKIKS